MPCALPSASLHTNVSHVVLVHKISIWNLLLASCQEDGLKKAWVTPFQGSGNLTGLFLALAPQPGEKVIAPLLLGESAAADLSSYSHRPTSETLCRCCSKGRTAALNTWMAKWRRCAGQGASTLLPSGLSSRSYRRVMAAKSPLRLAASFQGSLQPEMCRAEKRRDWKSEKGLGHPANNIS